MPTPTRAESLDRAAQRALEEVLRVLEEPRRHVEATAAAFAGLDARRRDDLQALEPRLRATLQALPAAVDGTGVVVAEDLLEDARLHLEWWRRGADGRPERLEVTYDPEDPAQFHYPDAEWFAVPRDEDRPWIAGPFVDSGGTNRHLCTYSVPVRGRDGTFIGIAGVDLRVGHVERAARRALAPIDAPAALVNGEHRVIACTEPGVAAGSLLRATPQPRGGVRDAVLPWSVVLL